MNYINYINCITYTIDHVYQKILFERLNTNNKIIKIPKEKRSQRIKKRSLYAIRK